MELKRLIGFLFITSLSFESMTDNQECIARKIQLMKPLFPSVNVSGYTIIEFDVNENGKVMKPRSKESKCLLLNKKTGQKEFKDCGVFIYESIAASRYIKFSKPINSDGKSCRLQNQQHKFTFINKKRADYKYFENIRKSPDLKDMSHKEITPLKTPVDQARPRDY